jgi:GlpG protein
MRHIGHLSDEQHAQRFSDYLMTIGMDLVAEEDPRGWALWIEHDDHVERAQQELAAFRANPDAARYISAQLQGARLRAENEKRRRKLREQHIDVRTTWAFGRQRARPLTLVLLLISVGLTLLMWQTRTATERSPVEQWMFISFIKPEAAILPEIRQGQVWRLVTPIFLHFGGLHLLFNMFWLWDLGGAIENRKGMLKLGGLVLVAAVLPNLMQYFWAGPAFGGMSGVVYALFGYVWMKGRYQPQEQLAVTQQTVFILLAWLVLAGVLIGNVANAAHAGGLAVGVVAGAGPYFVNRLRRQWR